MDYVYRPPVHYAAPQVFRPRPYEPYRLSWLFDRATQQYIRYESTWDSTGKWLGEDASPAVALGDVFIAPLLTPNGFPIVLSPDGTVEFIANGNRIRQTIAVNCFDSSLGQFYGSYNVTINNKSPTPNVDLPTYFEFDVDEVMTQIQLRPYASDPEADTITVSVSPDSPDDLYDWMDFDPVAGTIDGTPDVEDDTGRLVLIRFTDQYQGFTEVLFSFVVFDRVLIPDWIFQPKDDVFAEVESLLLTYTFTYRTTASFDPDIVLEQDPLPGTHVEEGTNVAFVISRAYPVSLVKTIRRREFQ